MKKLISALLAVFMFANVALADCDFSTGITPNTDGSYTYTKACHIAVGTMKRDLDTANTKIASYEKVIQLKDLSLTKSDERADLWMNTSFKMQDRLNSVDELKSKNQWLAFGLGIVFTSLAVYGAGQLAHK